MNWDELMDQIKVSGTEETVQAIERSEINAAVTSRILRLKRSGMTNRQLAKKYGVRKGVIRDASKGNFGAEKKIIHI